MSRGRDEIEVGTACASGQPPIRCSHVLLAVGRRPNTDGFGLEQAGVRTDERSYIVVVNLFDKVSRRMADRVPRHAPFIDPALGRIGMTETEARVSGRKLLFDADSQLLPSAAILGLNGGDGVRVARREGGRAALRRLSN